MPKPCRNRNSKRRQASSQKSIYLDDLVWSTVFEFLIDTKLIRNGRVSFLGGVSNSCHEVSHCMQAINDQEELIDDYLGLTVGHDADADEMRVGKGGRFQTGFALMLISKRFHSLVMETSEFWRSMRFDGREGVRDSVLSAISAQQFGGLVSEVSLANCPEITDASLQCIAHGLPNITSINLTGLSQLTDFGIGMLANCRKLVSLEFRNLFNLTDNGLNALFGSGEIMPTYLGIGSCTDVEGAINWYSPITTLEKADFQFVNFVYGAVTSIVRNNKRLYSINLGGFKRSVNIPESLSMVIPEFRNHVPGLKQIVAGEVGDSFLISLAKTCGSTIEEIDLHNSSLSKASVLKFLSSSRNNLRNVKFMGCRCVDRELIDEFVKCPKLEHLILVRCSTEMYTSSTMESTLRNAGIKAVVNN